jgi:hypothetical protein
MNRFFLKRHSHRFKCCKYKHLIEELWALPVRFSILLITVLLLNNCKANNNVPKSPEVSTIFIANLGSQEGEVGGLSEKERDSKDDPLAYSSVAYPQDFAIDKLGNIIIADTANRRIQKISNTGEFLFEIYNCGNEKMDCPYRIAINSKNEIIVGEETDEKICIFSPTGKFLKKFNINIIYDISEIETDEKDNIYIFSVPDMVYIYSKEGILLRNIKRNDLLIDSKNNLWDIYIPGYEKKAFQFRPKGNWKYVDLIKIDNNSNFYSIVSSEQIDLIVITDMDGHVKYKIDTNHFIKKIISK